MWLGTSSIIMLFENSGLPQRTVVLELLALRAKRQEAAINASHLACMMCRERHPALQTLDRLWGRD